MHVAVDDFRRKHDRLPRVVFLGNHGLITSADTAAEALQLTRRVVARVRDAYEALPIRRRQIPTYADEERANLSAAICDMLILTMVPSSPKSGGRIVMKNQA